MYRLYYATVALSILAYDPYIAKPDGEDDERRGWGGIKRCLPLTPIKLGRALGSYPIPNRPSPIRHFPSSVPR